MGEFNVNPAVHGDLPAFIAAPGETDVLMLGAIVVFLVVVLMIGNLYFQLHALPEKLSHKKGVSTVQMEIVAVLGLLALFTHNNLYWVIGLLIAMMPFPDFMTPLSSIATSLSRIAARGGAGRTEDADSGKTDDVGSENPRATETPMEKEPPPPPPPSLSISPSDISQNLR